MSNKHSLILTLFLSLVTSFGMFAQTRTLTGVVRDANGAPLIAAGVVVSGTTQGTVTNPDGSFTLQVPSGSVVLEVSSLGYVTKQVEVAPGERRITVVLDDDSLSLTETVVIGYGTMKRRDLTGAISHVSTEELTAYPVTDPIYALQGRVPGVVISQNTGSPEGDYTIRIRGVNSIKGSNDPLYIIDGIPSSTASINTYDIESLEVLKDASATAIYGSRGANGVVLITTKKGKSGKAKVQYDVQSGMQYQIKRLDLMDAQEWARFYNIYVVNSNTLSEPAFSDAEIAAMGKGTDWQREVFRPAPTTNHSVTVSGGSDNIRYFISGSGMLRDGLIENSYYDKYNIRSTIDADVNKYVNVTLNLGYTLIDKMNQTDGGGNGGSSMIGGTFSASPVFTPYDENGNYKDLRSWFPWSSHEIKNPLLMANESSYQTVTDLTDANLSIKFKPVKGLTITTNFATEISDAKYQAYTTEKYIYSTNSATITDTRRAFALNEDIVNYKAEVGNHAFDVMGAFSYQQSVTKTLSASGKGYISDVAKTYNVGSAETPNTPSSSYSQWVLMSWLGRFNYIFMDKYMLTLSFRADGSSRYSEGQRWGYFPSGAFAWRVSDEPWMKNIRQISDLKFRLGYGVTGSTAISAYATQNLLSSGKAATGSGNLTTYYPSTSFPSSLKWETTAQYNAGIDLGLFDQKLKITADYYYKYTYNLLNTVSLPWSSGYVSSTENI
ncbi:MAG: SusC/RagA family TonB-linked outer membrane protein, partial [Bacteroidales bacterium]|nr:SusC/RagA family TonB-linked outer membrane protein [Bacteroidales bacterium]